MGPILIIANIIAVIGTIMAIYRSERRWVSGGFAALGFALVVGAGLLLIPLFTPSDGDVVATNHILDTIGNGIQLAAPFAALFGAVSFGGVRKKS
jgi:hypothetical protein